MILNPTQARDEMLTLFRTAWLADAATAAAPIVYWDKSEDEQLPDPNTTPIWCRATIQHAGGGNDSIGNKIFFRTGTATIQIFTVYGSGLTNNDLAVKVALDAFQGKSTSGGVWFRNVFANEIGQDGMWFQTNVLASFEYTERI